MKTASGYYLTAFNEMRLAHHQIKYDYIVIYIKLIII